MQLKGLAQATFVCGILLAAFSASAQRQFRVQTLGSNGCRVVDHNSYTGDDRGGIATNSNGVFYAGDSSGVRYNQDLNSPERVTRRDNMVSDLGTGTVYLLWDRNGNRSVDRGGRVNGLQPVDNRLNPTGQPIALSQEIDISSTTLILAGFHAVGFWSRNAWHVVELPSGQVTNLGTRNPGYIYPCENWARWGILEYFDGNYYALFRGQGNVITRFNISQGGAQNAFSFSRISDMCSISAIPARNRWYFHYEGTGQWGGGSETLGYCAASFVTNSPPQWSAVQPVVAYAGQNLRINLTVTDPDDDAFDVAVEGLPTGAVYSRVAGKFRWTPTNDDAGVHTLRFVASEDRNDGQPPLQSEIAFDITVHAINRPPRFSSVPSTAVVQGATWTYSPEAIDPEGDGEITIELVEGPRGMTYTEGVARWAASAAPGEQVPVRFAALDGQGARGYQSFSLSVGANPLAPVALVIQGDLEVAPGALQLDGSPSYDPLGNPLGYSWMYVEGPEGMGPDTVDAPQLTESAQAKARVVLSRRGSYRFELIVSNGTLSSSPAAFVADVVNAAPVAVAGENQELDLEDGDEVNIQLDGTASYDPNPEDTFECVWAQVEGPPVDGLDRDSGLLREVTLLMPADYGFTLTCEDQELSGESSYLAVAAVDPTPPKPPVVPAPVPEGGCGATPVSLWLLTVPLFIRRRRRVA
jgi:hypothetical protein